MPLVIKELLIKAVVIKPIGERSPAIPDWSSLERLKKEIKQECIDELMEKIREQKER
jgi:HEPN domain-containing protein